MQLLIGFILGFIVATVGVSNLTSFTDKQIENAREIVRENVK